MSYVIVNTVDNAAIIGIVESTDTVDDGFITLESPFYISLEGSDTQQINIGFTDVLVFSDQNHITIPMRNIITYYNASDVIGELYDNYVIYYTLTRKQVYNHSIKHIATRTSEVVKEFLASNSKIN